jgi:hypothetical protein
MSDIPKDIQAQADQTALMELEFQEKLVSLKELENSIKGVWKNIEKAMIDNDVKSIKLAHDHGTITIADRTNYKAADLDDVPKKFLKRALDTKKIAAHKDLIGELPKGVIESHTKYLTKRIK